ncbi:hypothetical protein COO92_12615 [Thalassospira lohafexi]|uniref:Uncharacterized protein n=1 Tax=Thalassospira lohafexi TaxID=744227 RepID=A0A2N3L498_9PROT|nr:hypothetical protein COO92_12615 [Thalassospira lohafexi]
MRISVIFKVAWAVAKLEHIIAVARHAVIIIPAIARPQIRSDGANGLLADDHNHMNELIVMTAP